MAKQVLLAAKLDTAASAELRDTLIAAQDDDIVLEAGAVQMLGGACVELLMSAAALWHNAGRRLSIQNASPQFLEDLETFGLAPDTFLEDAA
ncbi:MAG: STAS domain-containing protein [Pseudomonadota bacterium]